MHSGREKKVSVLSCCGRRRNWRQRSERASWSNYLLFPPLAFPLDNLLLFCSAANDTKTDFRKREGGWSVLMIFQVSADPCYYSPFPPSFFFGGGRLNGGKAGAYFGTQLVKAEHQSPPPSKEWGAFPVPPWRQNCPLSPPPPPFPRKCPYTKIPPARSLGICSVGQIGDKTIETP